MQAIVFGGHKVSAMRSSEKKAIDMPKLEERHLGIKGPDERFARDVTHCDHPLPGASGVGKYAQVD
jgi:hypothetical protein